ncbi:MAG: NUDIX domain-containing protein [Alistipes sp.]|uniref:NUDIX domain-containing protein n=1 Tax=Alistipes sp. TaxID=1872444 RepID=UPI0039914F89
MPFAVYFADKELLFTDSRPSGADFTLRAEPGEKIGRAKVLKILENHNSLAVLSSDPAAAFEAFATDFIRVEAAGGVVGDACGAWLMIFRNGRWDLPKGHWEPGETIEECAVREVGEETGVRGVRIVRPLCETFHAYPMRGRWELKRTRWFEMRFDGACALSPQPGETIEECAVREVGEETGVRGVRIVRPLCETFHAYPMRGRWELKRTRWFEMRFDGACALSPQREEGIERVVWCPPSELDGRLRATFPTIRCVMACVG